MSKVELLPVAGEVSWRKNSPGRRSVLPYTSFAALHCRSVLSAVRIPRRTTGRVSIQCEGDEWALRADLSCRWKRSIIPFAIGWYRQWCGGACSRGAGEVWTTAVTQIGDHGTPKRAIQPEVNVRATVSAVMSGIGKASGQRVKRSMHVSK